MRGRLRLSFFAQEHKVASTVSLSLLILATRVAGSQDTNNLPFVKQKSRGRSVGDLKPCIVYPANPASINDVCIFALEPCTDQKCRSQELVSTILDLNFSTE